MRDYFYQTLRSAQHFHIKAKNNTKTKQNQPNKQTKKTPKQFQIRDNKSKVLQFLLLLLAIDSMMIEAHFCMFTVPGSTEMRRNYFEVFCHLGQQSQRAKKLDKWSGTAIILENVQSDVYHFQTNGRKDCTYSGCQLHSRRNLPRSSWNCINDVQHCLSETVCCVVTVINARCCQQDRLLKVE